jgi:hypothetical protein
MVRIMENSNNRIKLFSTKTKYYNVLYHNNNNNDNKTKKLLKQVKHKKLKNLIIN